MDEAKGYALDMGGETLLGLEYKEVAAVDEELMADEEDVEEGEDP